MMNIPEEWATQTREWLRPPRWRVVKYRRWRQSTTVGDLLRSLVGEAEPIKTFGVRFDTNIDSDGEPWEES